MKPDQHKKRRSAQYKKKHGIPKDKQDSSSRDKKVGKGELQESANSLTLSTGEQKVLVTQTQHSVQKDEKEVVPSFSRRKIESNWDRYEGLPDDDEDEPVTARGVEFSRLLSETGHSEAQFRFKDEQSWDGDDEHVSKVGTKLLSVDVEVLASHIKAIPIPERLGIPRSLFEDDILEKFDEDASNPSTNANDSCQPKMQGLPASTPKNNDPVQKTHETDSQNDDKISANDDSTSHKTTKSLKESLSSINRTSKLSQTHKRDESELGIKVEADGNDDLDFLLSLENPVEVKGQSTVTCGDDVDDHVGVENGSLEKGVKNESTQPSKPNEVETACNPDSNTLQIACKPDATDELEDWLDDMLDD